MTEGYLHVLAARRSDRVRAEPFGLIETPVGIFFGDDASPYAGPSGADMLIAGQF